MVGPKGEVVGVDMTDEQLAIAKSHQQWHTDTFGFDNVRFIKGYIEKLDELGLEPESFDVIVSNCVVNLSTDKAAVLKGVHGLLKPGGEMYFSDVYSDRRVPENVREDSVLYGECLGGALYWNDFLRLANDAGFADPRLVENQPFDVNDQALALQLGNLNFYSATYRLFKLDALETACEDYGQAVIYHGTVPQSTHAFVLDEHHCIETGRVFPVCGNTWRMLKDTRFSEHFTFIGDFSQHFGLFEGCGSTMPFDNTKSTEEGGLCC
jgi:SAM-dependent methyltransferase